MYTSKLLGKSDECRVTCEGLMFLLMREQYSCSVCAMKQQQFQQESLEVLNPPPPCRLFHHLSDSKFLQQQDHTSHSQFELLKFFLAHLDSGVKQIHSVISESSFLDLPPDQGYAAAVTDHQVLKTKAIQAVANPGGGWGGMGQGRGGMGWGRVGIPSYHQTWDLILHLV